MRLIKKLFGGALTSAMLLVAGAQEADVILHNGKVVMVDARFSIRSAIAIKDGKILKTGSDPEILELKGPKTEVLNLGGKMVLPGLIDSHVHSSSACLTEFDHPIPQLETIADVLGYIRRRATELPAGAWIEVRQVFITRLKEQRYPTKAELDAAAPRHPVIFATGPDASLNTLALQASGIDRDFQVNDGGSGFIEKDPETGEPTGILRNASRFVKVSSPLKKPTKEQHQDRLQELFSDYNSVGITSVCDRNASAPGIAAYDGLRKDGQLTVRVMLSHELSSMGSIEEVRERLRTVAHHPLFKERSDLLRIIGVKTFLDGGMLTGSAYMREPWGVSSIYGITDPNYRGVLFIPPAKLTEMVRAAVQLGMQFTAHAVGDGAVHTLLEAYEEVGKEADLQAVRPCISHSNFMSREAVEKAAKLGVAVDIQPAWLYHDTRTLARHFGYERLRYFQPLRSLFEAGAVAGGGSDHMQKIGSFRSINVYNPFLGMATAITREGKDYQGKLHPEEALTREQAIRFYTINNARMLFLDDKVGSLEAGKLADLIVLDRDLLTCPTEAIQDSKVLRTYLGGQLVHKSTF